MAVGSNENAAFFCPHHEHEHETEAPAENFVMREAEIIDHAAIGVWDLPRNGIKIVQRAAYELIPGDFFKARTCYYNN